MQMRIGMLARTVTPLLLLIGFVCFVDAQPPRGGRGPFRGGWSIGLTLARDAEVQQELGIDSKQVRMLDALQSDLVTQVRGRRQGRGNAPAREEVTDKLVATVLDDPQLKRLRQLEVQFEGISALERDRVAAALELSDQQQRSIREYRSTNSELSPEDVHKLVVEILSDQQLGKWNREIYGDAFRFSDDVQQFQRFITRFRNRGFRGPGRGSSDQDP